MMTRASESPTSHELNLAGHTAWISAFTQNYSAA